MSDQIASATDIYRLAQKYQRQGDLAEARSCLMKVLALEPDHSEAIHSLGNIDAREGRLEDAERLIRKAIAIRVHAIIEARAKILTVTNTVTITVIIGINLTNITAIRSAVAVYIHPII